MEAAYYQIDLMRVSPRKFCSLVYAFIIKNADEDQRKEVNNALDAALPGEAKRAPSQAEIDADTAAMLAFGASLSGSK